MRTRFFLIVGSALRHRLSETLSAYGRLLFARDVADAVEVVRRARRILTGMFIDIPLPGGSGLHVVDRARALGIAVPAVVVSSDEGDQFGSDNNRAFVLRAICLPAPVSMELVHILADRWIEDSVKDEEADAMFVDELVALGRDREEALSLIESILEKTGARTMAEAGRAMLAEALKEPRPGKRKRRRKAKSVRSKATSH